MMSNQKEELVERKTAAVSSPVEMTGKLDGQLSTKTGLTDDSFTPPQKKKKMIVHGSPWRNRRFATAACSRQPKTAS